MSKAKTSTIAVRGTAISILTGKDGDFISLTDIAKHKEPDRADQVIQNWMRNRNTVEFLGIWENLNNPEFKPLEFEGFRNRAGLNSFVLTPRQWIESTAAVGLISRSGRYGPDADTPQRQQREANQIVLLPSRINNQQLTISNRHSAISPSPVQNSKSAIQNPPISNLQSLISFPFLPMIFPLTSRATRRVRRQSQCMLFGTATRELTTENRFLRLWGLVPVFSC